MSTVNATAMLAYLRRLLPAALLAATAALGGSASVDPATACAAPNDEWDVGAYDQCVASYPDPPAENITRYLDHLEYCCKKSGGVYSLTQGCVAPPAAAQGPGVAPPPEVATDNPAPPPPPVTRVPPGVIETFTPAPIG
jgi:hypothetical protein